MSRAKIGVMVAVVVAALTLTAYFLTTASLEKRITQDVEGRVAKAQQLLIQNSSLEALGLMKRAEIFARDPRFAEALAIDEPIDRARTADRAFRRFIRELKTDEGKPDFLALVDKEGKVAAMLDVPRPEPEDWKDKFPAVKAAIEKGQVSKDVWSWRGGVLDVGVAPVYADDGTVTGAAVIAYALNARTAQQQADLLGMDVAYFHDGRVFATSFRREGGEENVQKQAALQKPLFDKGLATKALEQGVAPEVTEIDVDGEAYIATAARLPLNLSDKTSGAMVTMSLAKSLEPIGAVRVTILLLGLGALVIAILAMLVTARLILNPAEEIELGVSEIINGNIDYTFKPAGADFDGLANALNVMLARLLGRPEPGEDFEENGELRATSVLLDEEGGVVGKVATDEETLALAQEPEQDYYRRIFNEYTAARKENGENIDRVTYESFVAKLRLTEAKLKEKYSCRAVRFRVVKKDKQVTLKPVPIV